MSQIPLDLIGTSEPEPQNGPSSPSRVEVDELNNPQEESSRKPFPWASLARELQLLVSNFLAFASRFMQLCLRPEDLATIILDFWSLSLSIIRTDSQQGHDLLYPLSSLKKHTTGSLARRLLEHSRDLQQKNLHDASSTRDRVDPPRVAVIDLDEVSPDIKDRGYTVPADFHGFAVMVIFLEILISPILLIFSPYDLGPYDWYYKWLGGWVAYWFGDWIGAWFTFFVGLLTSSAAVQCMITVTDIFILAFYTILRGDGTLTLVRRSDISTPSCAVPLGRDFTVVLTGPQNVVEAVSERSFRDIRWKHGTVQWVFCEALKASCQGAPFAVLASFWFLLKPSLVMVFVPLALIAVVYFARVGTDIVRTLICRNRREDVDFDELSKTVTIATLRYLVSAAPTFLLIFIYELAIVKQPLFKIFVQPTIWLRLIPYILIIIHFISCQNYRIRTAKLLDILGSPPVRRWEFDTLAAAATFQCLVLCRGISRPVETINVLTLLDTFVPDERDVWKVWKARVADRIAHEMDISFAPIIPSFGDGRQKHLKELLDQAQIGYDAYTSFYSWHVPLHSTIAL